MSLEQALAKLEDGSYVKSGGHEMSREKHACHNCKQLSNLIAESKDSLNEDKSASLDSSLAFLTIVERIRSSGPGAGKSDILDALNKAAKDAKVNYKAAHDPDRHPPELLSSLLDHCAAARTEPALEAALEHLDLPTNNNLDVAERFLVTSSVSCMTLATTNAAASAYQDSSNVASDYVDHTNVDTSHIFFVEQLLQLLRGRKWSSHKLQWATQLAISNLVKCHNVLLSNEVKSKYEDLKSLSIALDQFGLNENLNKRDMHVENGEERNLMNVFSDELNVKVVDYLVDEYAKCKDTDCREVLLVSLGNTGNLMLVIGELEKVALQTKQRREQVAALKALKECLEFNHKHNPVNHIVNTLDLSGAAESQSKLARRLNYNGSGLHQLAYDRIKVLLSSVVYSARSETTSRILASELIAKYFSDDQQLINSLIRDMRHFKNFELTTLMWIKMQHIWQQRQLAIEKEHQLKHLTNWAHAPNVLNGSSTLFLRPLGSSSTMNATYGISMELLSAGKLLKETNFDIGLEGLRAAEQSVLGVSIFARGLSSFSGDDSGAADIEEEETQAGMSLRVLNVQLRPYTFFTGKVFWGGLCSFPIRLSSWTRNLSLSTVCLPVFCTVYTLLVLRKTS